MDIFDPNIGCAVPFPEDPGDTWADELAGSWWPPRYDTIPAAPPTGFEGSDADAVS